MELLRETPGVFPVLARDGWPKRPAETFANAKSVVFFMDGGGGHPMIKSRERMETMRRLMDQGVGLVCLQASTLGEHDPERVQLAIQARDPLQIELHQLARGDLAGRDQLGLTGDAGECDF